MPSSPRALPPLDAHVALVHEAEEARAAREPHDEVEREVVAQARREEQRREEQRLDGTSGQRSQYEAGHKGERRERQHGGHDRSEGAASHGQGHRLDNHRLDLGTGSPSSPLATGRLLPLRERRRRLQAGGGGAARRDGEGPRRSVCAVQQRRLERSRAQGERQRRQREEPRPARHHERAAGGGTRPTVLANGTRLDRK